MAGAPVEAIVRENVVETTQSDFADGHKLTSTDVYGISRRLPPTSATMRGIYLSYEASGGARRKLVARLEDHVRPSEAP